MLRASLRASAKAAGLRALTIARRTEAEGGSSHGLPTVAFVAHAVHERGGMERACAERIRRMHKRYRVVVVSSELDVSLRAVVKWNRVRVPRRPFPLRFAVFFVLAGLRLCADRPDLVHTLGAIVPNRADAAEIHFCHAGYVAATGGFSPEGAALLRRLNTSIARLLSLAAERWCYRSARLRSFVAVSDGVAAELQRHYPAIPVRVAPNGVDLDRYQADRVTRDALRAAYDLPDDAVVALFVGGDWDRKGLPIIVEALRHAPGVHLWVVGSGRESDVQARADALGVAERIRFFGPQSDTARFYAAADVFCLASLYETFSIAAHEASAAGLPIVASPVNGVNELIGRNEAGLLVDRNAEAIGHALTALSADPPLRHRLGSTGRKRVQARTWDASAAAVLALYEDLTADARGADRA